MPYPRLIALLDHWMDHPPLNEAFLGFIGHKPLSKDERQARAEMDKQALRKQFGPDVEYSHLPKWLRDMHAAQKKGNKYVG